MKSITEKIFDNEAGFLERTPKNAEYQKCQDNYDEACKKLVGTLNEEQKKLMNALDDYMGDILGVIESLYFRKGFVTGLRLGFEACQETDVLDMDEL